MDKILVSFAGIIGIIFTAWYFFGKKDEVFEVDNSVDILVKGGYSPSSIQIKKGKKTTLNFLRTDENSCLEEVVLSEFRIKRFLPLNKTVSVEIQPDKIGSFDFSCGMGMFHGKLTVKN